MQAGDRVSRIHTCCIDDAMRPAGIAKALKLLYDILDHRRLPIDPVQKALHLHKDTESLHQSLQIVQISPNPLMLVLASMLAAIMASMHHGGNCSGLNLGMLAISVKIELVMWNNVWSAWSAHILEQHPRNAPVLLQSRLEQPEDMPDKAGILHGQHKALSVVQ